MDSKQLDRSLCQIELTSFGALNTRAVADRLGFLPDFRSLLRVFSRGSGKRMLSFVLRNIALLLLLLPDTASAQDQWTKHALDLTKISSGKRMWPELKKIHPFQVLGISKNGWFAYRSGEERGLFNIACENQPCVSDSPMDKKDLCYCPGPSAKELSKHRVRPFKKKPQHGLFPAALIGDSFDVELLFGERVVHAIVATAEKRGPELPGTRILLVSKKRGRKQIGLIDHNHSGIRPGARVAGWLKSPYSDRIVVFILCEEAYGDTPKHRMMPFGAHLKHGFEQGKPDR